MNRHEEALKILSEGAFIPATPLALKENRSMDEETQRILIRYYLDAGAGGIATAVHSTQFAIRNPEHRLLEPVLQLVSEEIGRFEEKYNKIIVKISGVCGETDQAVSEAVLAKSMGYDAVLLSPGDCIWRRKHHNGIEGRDGGRIFLSVGTGAGSGIYDYVYQNRG